MLPREIVSKVRQIEIRTNRAVNTVLGGEYHSVFKGQGVEFSEVREYQIGDDVRSIDWNVTARTGHPHVKKFVEERELSVMLLVDASASQSFGSEGQNKREIASEIAAMLAFSAIKNNDQVGLIIFTDKVEKYVPPKKGRQHVLRLIREILYFQPEGKGTNIRGALEYFYLMQKRRSVVFLISDFLDGDFEKILKITAKKHDLIAVNITDPREEELPAGSVFHLEDPEAGENVWFDMSSTNHRKLYKEHNQARTAALQKQLKFIDTINIDTSKSYVDPLVRFFKQRERRYR
ncbi:MAG: DUF58 domain-containing protein [Candidatus Margulisiibacteriota bacterium]